MATQTTDIPGRGYGSTYIDSLIWGCGWTGGTITYSFGSGDVTADASLIGAFTGAAWSEREQGAFTEALANYSAVCNLQFEAAADPDEANIVWWLAPQSAIGNGVLGVHEVPDGQNAQVYGYFAYQQASWGDLTPGSYGYITVIHELGHGMGLAHPHDGGGEADATRFAGVFLPSMTGTYGMNQGIWTTMSYNDGWASARSPSSHYGYQGSLMALDIAALQALYGANMTTHTGDDVYVLPSANSAGTGWECLWDAGGSDTISNEGSASACTINLNAATLTGANAGGYVSRDAGIYGGFTIANGVTIENATGGSGRDTLVGNAAANRLDGGAGIDTMTGGAGDDTYVVDNTKDVVIESTGQGVDTVWSWASYTLAKNVENLVLAGSAAINGTGNSADNVIVGNSAKNTLSGSTGNDVIDGGGGADRLTGGAGADRFRFDSGDTGVGGSLRDVISDFKGASGDRIDLHSIDANVLVDGDQEFTLVSGTAFGHHAGELVFVRGVLAADTDGDAVADLEIQLTGVSKFLAAYLA